MGGFHLERRGQAEQFLNVAVEQFDVTDTGRTCGDGPRLVEHDGRGGVGLFEGFDSFDEQAVPSTTPRSHHQRRGRRQTKGARASDHQRGHEHHDGHLNGRHGAVRCEGVGHEPPNSSGQQRSDDDHRNKNGRDAVDQALNRGFPHLRFVHQTDDLRQHGFTDQRRGAHEQGAVEHDGARRHGIARVFAHREGFTGHHRFVHRGRPVLHQGVQRHRFTGPNLQQGVAWDLVHRCRHGSFVHDHPRFFRLQAHQAVNGVRGLELRIGFEVVAEKNEGDDEGGAVEEHVAGLAHERRQEGQQRGEGHQGGPQHGHRGAEVHEDVHVGASSSQRRPRVSVEISA